MSTGGRDQLRKELGVVLREAQKKIEQLEKNTGNLLEMMIDDPDVIDWMPIQEFRRWAVLMRQTDELLFLLELKARQGITP